MVARFRERLYLPARSGAHMSCRALPHATPAGKCVELYHVSHDNADGITRCGFGAHRGRGNKGFGLYLANHGRYASTWQGLDHAFVVHVPVSASMRRYRSEIKCPPGVPDSEYVVTDQAQAVPVAIIRFRIDGHTGNLGWNAGEDCDACRAAGRGRCDCALDPVVDPRDIVQ